MENSTVSYHGIPATNCRWLPITREQLLIYERNTSFPHTLPYFLRTEIAIGAFGGILSIMLAFILVKQHCSCRIGGVKHFPLLLGLTVNDGLVSIILSIVAMLLLIIPDTDFFYAKLVSVRSTCLLTPVGPSLCYMAMAISQCLALAKPFFYEIYLTGSFFYFLAIGAVVLGIGLWAGLLQIRWKTDYYIGQAVLGEHNPPALLWTKIEYAFTSSFLLAFLTATIATFTIVSTILYKRKFWTPQSRSARLFRLLRMEVCVYCFAVVAVLVCSSYYYMVTINLFSYTSEDCGALYLNYFHSLDTAAKAFLVQSISNQVWLLRIVIEPCLHMLCNQSVRHQLMYWLKLAKEPPSVSKTNTSQPHRSSIPPPPPHEGTTLLLHNPKTKCSKTSIDSDFSHKYLNV